MSAPVYDAPGHRIADLVRVLDPEAATARRGDTLLDLTATEFRLLCFLAQGRDRTLSKGQITTQVWGYDDIAPNLVEILARAKEELTYDLPEDLVGKIWKEGWRGQRQTWFLARFLGRDEDVNLDTPEPEFRAWKWAEPVELPALIVPFKKKLYEDVLEAFADWL